MLIVFVIIVLSHIKVVPQSQEYVVERIGSYYDTWQNGIHFLIPFIDKISKKVSLKEFVVDFKPQPAITKDNVTMQVDTVVYYQVTDSKLYTYGINNPLSAIENLTATTLRNIIGDLNLEETLTSRDFVNSKITATLDIASDKWGLKVHRVELKNILPPPEILDSMEKEMKADREKRETLLRAEGEKQSQILIAQGEREAQILRAQAVKETTILQADAVREQKIRESEGQAQAIRTVQTAEIETEALRIERLATSEADAIKIIQQAHAESLKMLSAANPTQAVLTLKSLESMEKVADGKATKIIIPSNMQGLAGLATTASELFKADTPEN